jgi:hypothetical protein
MFAKTKFLPFSWFTTVVNLTQLNHYAVAGLFPSKLEEKFYNKIESN